MTADPPGASWRRSSLSAAPCDCVEVAVVEAPADGPKAGAGTLHVLRGSKDPDGPKLFFTQSEWDAFVGGVKLGEFDA
ncbi:DUF397 domain-containing protein [Planobispora siamensis]|uniref:DUF397 domain-containing protein n=1 Tax=Planobispora siamensis TaxID=936338 RepID=A0A8J3SHQ4_9ACTN|nr:DUF397 domain-containing protein [Planobispora siamensis]GIH94537.1 DUF397 domain-containing protein [Planobispora siamensis]